MIKLVNEDFIIILKDHQKIIERFNYNKDGSPCRVSKERIWKGTNYKDINDLVEYFKNLGFKVEC